MAKYRHKYGVSKPEERTLDGIVFHSKREMRDYLALTACLERGAISNLKRQVRFPFNITQFISIPDSDEELEEKFTKTYVADFVYKQDGEWFVHETKGMVTKAWKEKKRWFEALYTNYRLVVA